MTDTSDNIVVGDSSASPVSSASSAPSTTQAQDQTTATNAAETVQSDEPIVDNSPTFNDLLTSEKNGREQQDKVWHVVGTKAADELNEYYSQILADGVESGGQAGVENFEKYMLRVLSNMNVSWQGKFTSVPFDYHTGPFINPEDEYIIVYGDEQRIKGNCNHAMMETIGNTEITRGMKAYAEKIIWNNGLICYNEDTILVRGEDNKFGQPGSMDGFLCGDRLAIQIMKRYIVPQLIHKTNRDEYTNLTNPRVVREFIVERYTELRNRFLPLLAEEGMTEDRLFDDAPIAEKIGAIVDDSELRILELERRVEKLERQLAQALAKIEEVEDIALDASIAKTEEAIHDSMNE